MLLYNVLLIIVVVVVYVISLVCGLFVVDNSSLRRIFCLSTLLLVAAWLTSGALHMYVCIYIYIYIHTPIHTYTSVCIYNI